MKGAAFPLAAAVAVAVVAVAIAALGSRWYNEFPSPPISFSSMGAAVEEYECEYEFECEWASVISIPGGIRRVLAEADGENCGKTAGMLGACVCVCGWCGCCSCCFDFGGGGLLVAAIVVGDRVVAEESAAVASEIFAKLEEGTGCNVGLIVAGVLHGGGGDGGDSDDDDDDDDDVDDDKDAAVSVSFITAEAACDNRLRGLVVVSEGGVVARSSVVSGL